MTKVLFSSLYQRGALHPRHLRDAPARTASPSPGCRPGGGAGALVFFSRPSASAVRPVRRHAALGPRSSVECTTRATCCCQVGMNLAPYAMAWARAPCAACSAKALTLTSSAPYDGVAASFASKWLEQNFVVTTT